MVFRCVCPVEIKELNLKLNRGTLYEIEYNIAVRYAGYLIKVGSSKPQEQASGASVSTGSRISPMATVGPAAQREYSPQQKIIANNILRQGDSRKWIHDNQPSYDIRNIVQAARVNPDITGGDIQNVVQNPNVVQSTNVADSKTGEKIDIRRVVPMDVAEGRSGGNEFRQSLNQVLKTGVHTPEDIAAKVNQPMAHPVVQPVQPAQPVVQEPVTPSQPVQSVPEVPVQTAAAPTSKSPRVKKAGDTANATNAPKVARTRAAQPKAATTTTKSRKGNSIAAKE